jgi:hypothetical protein
VPAIADLAAMRDAIQALGGDPAKINPLIPAELVIDHSVAADVFGSADAFRRNVEIEFSGNRERFEFLRWGQRALSQFKAPSRSSGVTFHADGFGACGVEVSVFRKLRFACHPWDGFQDLPVSGLAADGAGGGHAPGCQQVPVSRSAQQDLGEGGVVR